MVVCLNLVVLGLLFCVFEVGLVYCSFLWVRLGCVFIVWQLATELGGGLVGVLLVNNVAAFI